MTADVKLSAQIRSHRDLTVYQRAFAAASKLLRLSRAFPREETYSLTDQVRRSSRSVTSNMAEGWRKRRYEAAFVSKMNDAEAEAAETQCWIEHAVDAGCLDKSTARDLYREYEQILRLLVAMINNTEKWCLPSGIRT